MTRWTTILALVAILGFALTGCGDGGPEEPTGGGEEEGNGTPAMTAPPIPVPEATYEIGCAGCIFGEDVSGCITAVKVGDEVYVVEGAGVPDAHTTGLCTKAKQAVVAGQVKDGILHATKFVVSE